MLYFSLIICIVFEVKSRQLSRYSPFHVSCLYVLWRYSHFHVSCLYVLWRYSHFHVSCLYVLWSVILFALASQIMCITFASHPRWLSGLRRSLVHSLMIARHCVLRNWDRILVRAVKGLISRAGMVSICPLLWQRDVKTLTNQYHICYLSQLSICHICWFHVITNTRDIAWYCAA